MPSTYIDEPVVFVALAHGNIGDVKLFQSSLQPVHDKSVLDVLVAFDLIKYICQVWDKGVQG